jgi:hypothetical protein
MMAIVVGVVWCGVFLFVVAVIFTERGVLWYWVLVRGIICGVVW